MKRQPIRFGLSAGRRSRASLTAVRAFAYAFGKMLRRPVIVRFLSDPDRLLEGVLLGAIDMAWMPRYAHRRAIAEGAVLAAVTERRARDGFVLSAPMNGWKQAMLRDALLRLHLFGRGASALQELLGERRLAPVRTNFSRRDRNSV
jgi:hypothetical protein